MFDPIEPPAARRPEEALELVSQALSDGDLEAALAQYEKAAVLAYWPCWPRGDEPEGPPGTLRRAADGDARQALTSVMALRLPLYVRIATVLESPELALVICERRVTGTGPDGEQVHLIGYGCAVLRPQPDGAWRIAADAWRMGTETEGDPVPGDEGNLIANALTSAGTGHDPVGFWTDSAGNTDGMLALP